MLKSITLFLALILIAGIFTGCIGIPAVIAPAPNAESLPEIDENALQTGLSIRTRILDGQNAADSARGEVRYGACIAAVALNPAGEIVDCILEDFTAVIPFDASGKLLQGAEIQSPPDARRIAADALSARAIGKTVDELKQQIQANPEGCTEAIAFGHLEAIEAAASEAQYLGTQAGDALRLAVLPSLEGSGDGSARLDADAAALTLRGEIIGSCIIDSVQAEAQINDRGAIISDLSAPILSKNQLGEAYGMKAYAGSAYEWNEQAAAFAAYARGKTPVEIAGIAVDERNAPAEYDLASSVTISIGGFQALIAKAAA